MPHFVLAKSLVACIDDHPPYQILEPKPHGVHINALKKLATLLARDITFINAPNFARCVKMLEMGHVDVIAGLNKTKERDAYAFYAPYKVEEPLVVITKVDTNIKNYHSLYNQLIGVPRGTLYFDKFDNDLAITKVPVKDVEAGIKMLKKERLEAVITSRLVAHALLEKIQAANLKTTEIKREGATSNISYFGFSKRHKIGLSEEQIISKVTHAFEQGLFNPVEN